MKRAQAFAALIAAALANMDWRTPIELADRLTKRALDKVREVMGEP